VSALTGEGIEALKKEIIKVSPKDRLEAPIIGDLLRPGDTVVLVTPIDTSAPKGRLILPQVQTIREVLDADGMAFVTKERELRRTLESLKTPPRMVVTDSQAFLKVAADTPREIPLTSFSILFARYKGDLLALAQGAKAIMDLHAGDKVLIAESCTHHKQADDIGTVKIPRWLRQYVGGPLQIDHAHGGDFPENLSEYKLVIHCGGCMTNRQAMLSRIFHAQEAGVPITNYGVAIAFLQGIFPRALEPFPEIHALFA
ncbi:MAG: [FeFe] hydrogenase H-cluster maturation GTPase HydF, partial [Bacteroidota bacterium]